MIEIKILDNRGIELSVGDVIRYANIAPVFQEESGDNIPFGGYYRHQVDTSFEWVEEIFAVEPDEGYVQLPPYKYYDRYTLCDIFGVGDEGYTDDDYYREAVLDYLYEFTESKTEEGAMKEINGFTIVIKSMPGRSKSNA
jgi:hypothetical protein